jgi:hypothetical protein
MKKVLTGLAIAVLALGLVGTATGATDTSSVTVTVPLFDLLTVSNSAGITLSVTPGDDKMTGSDASALLWYVHTGSGQKKVTAEVTTDPSGDDDITLTVEVAGGSGQQTVYSSGTATAAKNVYTNIARGILWNKTVTYTAAATTTEAGAYTFVVTFTSTDQ